ncbi:hypothetical protein WBG78_15785 [Chryseolinea sp. T2]|uniref:hypothetical protein n=1 Tax=Chryseolinea sp. T2 TaxID=3129255 RepID=UPI003076DF3D
MRLPSLTAKQWLELKVLCGDIYCILRQEKPIPDSLHFGLLAFMDLEATTTTDYVLYGSIQFKAITIPLTLLYMDSEPPDKRHVFILPTSRVHRIWHAKPCYK